MCGATTRVVPGHVPIAANSTTVNPAIDIFANFSGGRLSEAEKRTVSVLTFQEAKIADAIKVTYLGNNW
jgi:hypothetical protein